MSVNVPETSHNEINQVRRSERMPQPTEKMAELRKDEAVKREKSVMQSYSHWKELARRARRELKGHLAEKELGNLLDELEEAQRKIEGAYDDLRKSCTPENDLRRRVDAVSTITTELKAAIYERITIIDDPFDDDHTRKRLNKLSKLSCAHSVFGSTISLSGASVVSTASSKRVDAAADLAAKEAELLNLNATMDQRKRIEEQQRELDRQQNELARLEAESEVRIAKARLQVYDKTMSSEEQMLPASGGHIPNDIGTLVSMLSEGLAMGRVPTPEPSIFYGGPLQFLEWKASFMALIDGKGISPIDKLHHLKRYVGGEARSMLEANFMRNDYNAYDEAWVRLNQRYGHPFILQRAFRNKISKWKRIASNDASELRRFSDFLGGCLGAMSQVTELKILNDCEENQKMVQKLPDGVAARWNRQVTEALMKGEHFPCFSTFVSFLKFEAEIACNPVTSFGALNSSTFRDQNRSHRPDSARANVLSMQSVIKDQGKSKTNEVICIHCGSTEHDIIECNAFNSLTLEARREKIKTHNLCYGCLKVGHGVRVCRNRLVCTICRGKHPKCLHNDSFNLQMVRGTALNAGTNTGVSTSMVIPVWISSTMNPTKEQLVYALLDTQSDTTFVDETLGNQLDVVATPVKLKLTTLLGNGVTMDSTRISGLRVRGYNSSTGIDLPAVYTKEGIPLDFGNIPTSDTAKQWTHLQHLAKVIPPKLDCKVGLLIGFNCSKAMIPREVVTGEDFEPYAVKTDLGWSIVGSSPCPDSNLRFCLKTVTKEVPVLNPSEVIKALERDFLDKEESSKAVSQDDICFLNKLHRDIRRNGSGHYEMPLPFKFRPLLPNNKRLAQIRLSHLKTKLLKNKSYYEHYVKFMSDIMQAGDVEEVMGRENNGEVWYIPHHGVYHPQKPNKLRVVFDCSAQYQGTSLNEHLLVGPELMNNLTGVLIRFRQHPIALTCDIMKMFHQFHVNEKDRNYLRFLWWKDGNLDSLPQEFRMKVHLFGASSSPGCANYGLKHIAKTNGTLYPKGAEFINQDFYVDDGLASVATVEEAIQLAREARELCALGGLKLHKFISNSDEVLNSIPTSECADKPISCQLAVDGLPIERVLGINWEVEEDLFRFIVSLKDQPPTRRGILSVVSSLFDPLGLVSPFLLEGKILLQEMCRNGTNWDDPLPKHLFPRWEHWKRELMNLSQVKIPRCYAPKNFGRIVTRELHHFSDASNKGYGQCSYLRLVNEKEEVHCTLVMSKARVAPIKVTTIPRLELAAAVVSATTSCVLKEEMNCNDITEQFWTDSKVVLSYIKNEARRFHTFVANRVQKIHKYSAPDQWNYISTNENPADHASRGLSVGELASSTWFSGPLFLWSKNLSPSSEISADLGIGDPEVRRAHTLLSKVDQNLTEGFSISSRLSKFSSWIMAVRAVARLCRRAKGNKTIEVSSVAERREAELIIIKDLQKNHFATEITSLARKERVASNSKLNKLDPFLDDVGVLRVGGRLRQAAISHLYKHPAVLPSRHAVSSMIISYYHEKVRHQGKGMTITEIRSNGYWIVGISRAVSSHLHRCVNCRKLRRPVEEQKMADLPRERVDPSPPFVNCGMDCFGPFTTRLGRKEYKRYGLLFTCFCSRAIHIEMLNDLTTDSFLNGLRCFIAIRGAVRKITCDQGSNFIGAKGELDRAFREMANNRISGFLAAQQCEFSFNAPHSSHTGGVWERQIRSVRNVLRSTILMAGNRLDDASLKTFLYEAMAIVNSRPITTDNLHDPNSLEPLTPNHLVTMKCMPTLPPPGEFVKEDMYSRKRWRQVQYLSEQFWSRWRKEYLSDATIRQRWVKEKRNMKVGDIVLDKSKDLPRNQWRLARVIETLTSKDGLVRKVKLFTRCPSDGKARPFERPVQNLVVLIEAP